MKLTAIESQSALWLKLTDYMESRLDTLRRKNDNNLTDLETSRLRGRIAEIQSFAGLGKPEPANSAENGDE